MNFPSTPIRRRLLLSVAATVTLGACVPYAAIASGSPPAKILAVGAENEYANVIGQIGGPFVSVSAIESNPNTDPHTFEASPSVAREVAQAKLIVQNGVGYDDYMNKIESGSPNASRKVIVAQSVLGLPNSTPNPHLWYSPGTMPAVAKAIAADLSQLDPAGASTFQANLNAFLRSLTPWNAAITSFKSRFGGNSVATTEPVADYLLTALGLNNRTPWAFQADIMNGVDPAPQDVSLQQSLFNKHQVKVFVYNQQVTDSLTDSLLSLAHKDGIPVVGVYETMPTPGYTYQTWMMAEVNSLVKALAHKQSTTKL